MTVLRVLDVETTGLEATDEVIEIGYCDLTTHDEVPWQTQMGDVRSKLFGCARPCPPEVVAVHHITAADIAGLELCTPRVMALLAQKGCSVLAAHNAEFEAKWFTPEVLGPTRLICTLKAAYRVWPDAPGHGNQVLRYWLGLDLSPELAMPPHRAGPDAYVTALITRSSAALQKR